MKKRLKKKKRIGEFQEFGFKVGFRFSSTLTHNTRNDLLDRFIKEAIEDNGLQFGGGGGDTEWNGFAALDKTRGSATEDHRKTVEQWFLQESEVLEYYISTLIDAWYGDFDTVEENWIKK